MLNETLARLARSVCDHPSQPRAAWLFVAGQSAAAVDHVVAAASTSAGNTTLNLPDGSTLTLVGLTHIDSSFFR